jgi:hypothetical protein
LWAFQVQHPYIRGLAFSIIDYGGKDTILIDPDRDQAVQAEAFPTKQTKPQAQEINGPKTNYCLEFIETIWPTLQTLPSVFN